MNSGIIIYVNFLIAVPMFGRGWCHRKVRNLYAQHKVSKQPALVYVIGCVTAPKQRTVGCCNSRELMINIWFRRLSQEVMSLLSWQGRPPHGEMEIGLCNLYADCCELWRWLMFADLIIQGAGLVELKLSLNGGAFLL